MSFQQIIRVQGDGVTNGHGTASGSATSIPDSVNSVPKAGNILVAVIFTSDSTGFSTVTSIAQVNVAWSPLGVPSQRTDSGNNKNIETWIGIVSPNAGTSITINLNGTLSFGGVANICEYSGESSNPLDKTATNNGFSGSPTDTGTTPTPTQGPEVYIGGIGTEAFANPLGSPQNGFTLLDGAIFNGTMAAAYLEKIVTVVGIADSGTDNVDNQPFVGIIVTLKAAAISGVTHFIFGDGLTFIST